MEIKILKGQSCYIPGRVNVGLWKDGKDGCFLIDSGGDETSGRRLFRLIQENNLKLRGILNTHSNADHVGGNAYLQKKTACPIWASSIEDTVIQNPFLEPMLLWGAAPFRALTGKFLQAAPSLVTQILSPGERVPDTDLTVLALPGHFINMIGFLSADGVCYIADSLFAKEVIEKYRFMVAFDVEATLATLDMLEKLEAAWFVPCHAEPVEDIRPLVNENRKGIEALSHAVHDLCSVPRSREEILALLVQKWDLEMNPVQYVLNSSSLSAYLTFLEKKGLIVPFVEKGNLLWQKKH
ncbi:MAG: MBL fold metallo-hydrolase [Aminobacterium colombiense]|uniref:Beta-lactamase domain protein n=1 Tax=Aminobacterium colombiense (strain DSM 12261 / ALA-1) TaxID=572547 RepID=D5EDC8_AMICL|nr:MULTISPECIES: MBL fold metallo-hydrolase [Aminobacterium]MDD2379081.1 MBL fold metallo-hydrolase [Aminobacterium colombiense]ADE56560.1 beta-lactamase domain protein [Aminobacterium colombiense DSM 12261]MDD3768363.1 MBL fold metallo-hydrolase [Aminobacterium colombiense]MDD4265233.1 MBL fold metallo-hydrolase [Aminobacterium colombiense]MDD4585762.1 MBL fold metallo-hydrolase [Aminobacterium colombiense]